MPTALITGASRGIGRAIAEALAARGFRLALHFRARLAEAESVRAALPGTGHVLIPADLTTPDGASALWSAAVEALGVVNVLVNNAGLYELHPPVDTASADWHAIWDRTLAVNLTAAAHLSHLAARELAARGGGRIIAISSRGAFRGEPDAPAYAASKAGLNALIQSLARALAPRHVYTFVIAPGWVDTDMAAGHLDGPDGAAILAQHPLGRIATPAEIATVAAFCATDAPAAMTGAIIDVNGASYLRS